MPRVILDKVSKVFDGPRDAPVRALSEVSLAIEERECLAVVGPSGSGKTTALRLIAGLETPTSGEVWINGKVVNALAPKNRDVAMVFQNPALYPHMSVYENLGFGLRLRGWPGRQADTRIKEIAEMLGITTLLTSMPMTLSGGQRQRVAIGRALARRPGALLLDEPLANIDPVLRVQMRTEITALRQSLNITMIYVTHDHLEAFLLGDRVAVLHEGVLHQVANPLSLYKFPVNTFVAGFVGARPMNLLDGVLEHNAANDLVVRLSTSSPAASEQGLAVKLDAAQITCVKPWLGKSVVLGLRAENIGLASGPAPEMPSSAVSALVTALENTGPDLYVHASSRGCRFVARVSPGAHLAVGQECRFQLDAQGCCLFDPGTGKAITRLCAS